MGHTPDGAPFFVMELIHGRSFVDHCTNRNLSLRDRLGLFADVCRAVHYAHQRGVMHRDLKPANILVDEEGKPRILDFGLARFTDADLNLTVTHSGTHSPMGTFPYMSPEQASGSPDDLDIRTDVYSLGVILFELLTGRYPYDVSGPISDVVRNIQESAPVSPSSIRPEINSEVSAIVLKALAKRNDDRYASAEAFADDVGRYLRGEAIVARPPTLAYQVRVFARRNKTVVGAAAVVVVALVLGVIGTAMGLAQAKKSRADALQGIKRLSRLNTAHRDLTVGGATTFQRVLDETAAWMSERSLASEVDAPIRVAIGRGYSELSLYDTAEPHLVAAVDSLRRHEENRELLAQAIHDLANVHRLRGHDTRIATTLFQEALAIRRELFGNAHRDVAETLYHLANLYVQPWEERLALHEEARNIRQAVLGDDDPDTLESVNKLAALHRDVGDFEKAGRLFQDVLDGRRNVLGNEHPDVAQTLYDLGQLLFWQAAYSEAESLFLQVLAIRQKVFGDEHPTVGFAIRQLGELKYDLGEYEEAKKLLREALAILRKRLNGNHAVIMHTKASLGRVLRARGSFEEAATRLGEALSISLEVRGSDHAGTGRLRGDLGLCLARLGQHDQAEDELIEAYRVLTANGFGRKHPLGFVNSVILPLALNDAMRGRIEEASRWLDESERLVAEVVRDEQKAGGSESFTIGWWHRGVGECLMLLGRHAEAEDRLLAAHRILVATRSTESGRTVAAVKLLVALYEAWGKPDEAAAWQAKLDDIVASSATEP